jgi:hypothetical protein
MQGRTPVAQADGRILFDADLKRRSVLSEYGLLPGDADAARDFDGPDAGDNSPSANAARALNFLVDLAAKLCGVPFSAVNIITPGQQIQLAAAGLDPGLCAREDSMCAKVFHQGSTKGHRCCRSRKSPRAAGPAAPARGRPGFGLGTCNVRADRKVTRGRTLNHGNPGRRNFGLGVLPERRHR